MARAPRPGPSRSTGPRSRPLGDYLELAGHHRDRNAPLFQPTQARWAGRPLTGDGIYKLVQKYASVAAIPMERIVHALRATAATNALEHEADIARVQDWLGHANVSTTRLYDRSATAGPRTAPRSASATDVQIPARPCTPLPCQTAT